MIPIVNLQEIIFMIKHVKVWVERQLFQIRLFWNQALVDKWNNFLN